MENLTQKEIEKQSEERKNKKKRARFSKLIVSLIVIFNVVFTAAVLYTFYRVGHEPTVLIGAWFGFTTGELWMMSSIKKQKVKENNIDEY